MIWVWILTKPKEFTRKKKRHAHYFFVFVWRVEKQCPALAGDDCRIWTWKCRCSGAECVICVIAPGTRNCLAKVTDGVWSRRGFAVTEAQEALSSNSVFIVVKSRSRQQQCDTQSNATMVRHFKVAFSAKLFLGTFFAAIFGKSV